MLIMFIMLNTKWVIWQILMLILFFMLDLIAVDVYFSMCYE